MGLILAGLFFIFFDFTITYNSVGISLLPAFLGFFLAALGSRRLKERFYAFDKAYVWFWINTVVNILVTILYISYPIKESDADGLIGLVVCTLSFVAFLILANGIIEIEDTLSVALHGKAFRVLVIIRYALIIVNNIALMKEYLELVSWMVIVTIVLQIAIFIFFIEIYKKYLKFEDNYPDDYPEDYDEE